MTNFTVFKSYSDAPTTLGTSNKGYIDATYSQLVEFLGEPTINEPSGDDKIQVEWILKYCDETFTIYDWKTYNRDYTENTLKTFNVGGRTNATNMINFIEQSLV